MTKRIKVAVNGYGVIGKRVADAVRHQPDMDLAGVADVGTDYRIKTARELGIPVYASIDDRVDAMRASGINVQGTLDDLLQEVSVVVDCTPKGVGAKNLARYRDARVKAIFQGGEKHELTGHSFVAQANYVSAVQRDSTRVVSCNTTSIVRTLSALRQADLLKKARGVLIRRATDPWEADQGGIMNTVVPEAHVPSHQAPDAKTVIPDLDVETMAAKAAHTQYHVHFWVVELTRAASRDDVLAAFDRAPRIAFVEAQQGMVAPNSTQELMRDLRRDRGDLWEVALWADSLTTKGTELYYTYHVDNQAIVIPETVDAIRALTGSEKDAAASIRLTDEALGIKSRFI